MYISKITQEISIVPYLYLNCVCTLKIRFHLVKWLKFKTTLLITNFHLVTIIYCHKIIRILLHLLGYHI